MIRTLATIKALSDYSMNDNVLSLSRFNEGKNGYERVLVTLEPWQAADLALILRRYLARDAKEAVGRVKYAAQEVTP